MGESLCRLCVSNVFGVRSDFDTDTSHVLFPQGVLAIIIIPLDRGFDWC